MPTTNAKDERTRRIELTLDLGNASARGNIRAMLELMASGALFDRGSLILAAANGRMKVIQIILKSGHVSSGDKGFALCRAIQCKHYRIADMLVRDGANPNCKEGIFRTPPLVLAADCGASELVEQLLIFGADVNSFEAPIGGILLGNPVERTALMAAAVKGRERIVRILLSAGADISVRNAGQKTAFDLVAGRKDRVAIARLLSKASKRSDELHEAKGQIGSKADAHPSLRETLRNWPETLGWLARRLSKDSVPYPRVKKMDVYQITVNEAVELLRKMGKKPAHSITSLLTVVRELTPKIDEVGGSIVLICDPAHGYMIGAAPWDDKFETLRAFKTASANYEVTNRQLISFLKRLDQRHPFAIERCDSQTIGGRFTGQILHPAALADELANFCPFILEDFGGQKRLLAKSLKENGTFTLSWN